MLDGVKTLDNLKQLIDKPQQNYWSLLKDTAGSMDIAQVTYVMSQEPVKESYKELMESFNNYLFERFKEDFASVPAFQPTIEKYIDTITKTAQSYGKHAMDLEEENKKLKQELEELRNADRH